MFWWFVLEIVIGQGWHPYPVKSEGRLWPHCNSARIPFKAFPSARTGSQITAWNLTAATAVEVIFLFFFLLFLLFLSHPSFLFFIFYFKFFFNTSLKTCIPSPMDWMGNLFHCSAFRFPKNLYLKSFESQSFFPLLKESIQTQQDQLELGSDPFFFFFFFPHSTLNFQNTEVTSNIMSINISCIILVSMDTTRISGITICCTRLTSTLSGSSVSLCRVAVVELGTTIKVNPS